MSDETDLPPVWLGFVRLAARIAIVVLAVVLIHNVMDWAILKADQSQNMPLMLSVLGLLLLSYALLLAVPFVPGIEIGLSLLILRGSEVAPFVYIATVLGLALAFLVGRFLPHAWLHGVFADLRMVRACRLIEKLEPMDRKKRLAHLTTGLPGWMVPIAGTGRYLILAVLLNVPGNALVGGGGGIALASGFSRLFRPWLSILVIAAAVLPVPLGVWLYGAEVLRDP